MSHHRTHIARWIFVIAAASIALSGCETLRSLLTLERPEVRLEEVALSELSFDGAEITARLSVDNPNPIGISLAGFSWELLVEGNRFLDGDVTGGIQIDANGTSPVLVPVAFGFLELREAVRSVSGADEVAYDLNLDFRFELPILGAVSVPVHAEGTVPVPKLPSIRVSALRLDRITFSGAELELEIVVSNPNAFGLAIDSLEYDFSVGGDPWVTGRAPRAQAVGAGDESIFVLPFTLQFSSVGRAVRDVLMGDSRLQYDLSVLAAVGTDLPLLPAIDLPLDLSGTIALSR